MKLDSFRLLQYKEKRGRACLIGGIMKLDPIQYKEKRGKGSSHWGVAKKWEGLVSLGCG